MKFISYCRVDFVKKEFVDIERLEGTALVANVCFVLRFEKCGFMKLKRAKP